MSHRFGPRTRLTGLVQSALVKNWLGRVFGYVQLAQRGTVSIADPATTNTATITSIDTTRTVVRSTGFDSTTPQTAQGEASFAVSLTNATTVTGIRGAGGSPSATLVGGFEAIQYSGGVIKRIQTGTVAITNGNATGTATISAVTTTKAQLVYGGAIWDNATFDATNVNAYMTINSSTQVAAVRTGTTGNWTGYFSIVEFN